jgi:hypothetical protein
MSYVDAGYVAAVGGCFLYGLTLFLRRRRWERALAVTESDPDEGTIPPGARD